MDRKPRPGCRGGVYVLVCIVKPILSGAGRGRFYERGFGTGPRGCGKGTEARPRPPERLLMGGLRGECSPPLAGPVQKRSNHTGKEVEKRGRSGRHSRGPLLFQMGQDTGRGPDPIKDQGVIAHLLRQWLLWFVSPGLVRQRGRWHRIT